MLVASATLAHGASIRHSWWPGAGVTGSWSPQSCAPSVVAVLPTLAAVGISGHSDVAADSIAMARLAAANSERSLRKDRRMVG